MTAETLECDLLVIGGGPAGLAASAWAARRALHTVLVDERVTLGGQIYKQPGLGFVVENPHQMGSDFQRGQQLIAEATTAGVEILLKTAVVSIRDTTAILLREGHEHTTTLHAKAIVIASGAHDRPVAFPGWTLPGVITAGGAQTLVKASRVVMGDRVAFAGSGPVALAFPAQLRHYGVNVVLTLEAGAAPGSRALVAMAGALRGNGALIRDGISYRRQLLQSRVPLRYRRIIVRAEGMKRVEAIVHAKVDRAWRIIPGTEESLDVDTLCLGYGFVPSGELFRLLGCQFDFDEDLGGPVVALDEWCRTSVPGVYGAGDGTGVRGSLAAVDQGRLAAVGVAAEQGIVGREEAATLARPYRRRLAAKERFRKALGSMFAVGPGIFELATPETTICRCEEVTRARVDEAIAATSDINAVKSYTRAGMGLCQGRNCQRQISAMIASARGVRPQDLDVTNQRPPVRPVPLRMLADDSVPDKGLFTRD